MGTAPTVVRGRSEVVGVVVATVPPVAVGLVGPLAAERPRAGEGVADRRTHGVRLGGQAELDEEEMGEAEIDLSGESEMDEDMEEDLSLDDEDEEDVDYIEKSDDLLDDSDDYRH